MYPEQDYRNQHTIFEEDGSYHSGGNKKKRNQNGKKTVALALCCALLGGGCGFLGGRLGSGNATTEIAQSGRVVSEVKLVTVDGLTQMSMSEVYAANVDKVVSINTASQSYNVFGQPVESASSGSGFILTADGYIVTNYHVIDGATSVKVTLYDSTEYTAQIVGGDADYDIAILKIQASDLPTVVLGDSDKVAVGDTIAAIGNPLGELTFSMSSGVVSCVNRAINVDGTPFNTIQVDASINPGNSGGPLYNSYGEVVGIVSAKYSSYGSTTVEGVGFAIPINDVATMIQDLMTNGFVTNKPYLAITGGTVNASMAKQQGMVEGVYVYSLQNGGAAAKAGMQIGDIIVAVDGQKIASMEDLNAVKKQYHAGDTASFTLYRQGETRTVELTFDAAPQNQEAEQSVEKLPQQNGQGNDQYYYDYWESILGDMFRGYGR